MHRDICYLSFAYLKKLHKVQSLLVDDLNLIMETKIYSNLMLRCCIHVVCYGSATLCKPSHTGMSIAVEALKHH
jgi:hypothetical protein